MSEKKRMNREDYWASVREQAAAYERGEDDVAQFLATVEQTKKAEQAVHEV